MNFRKYLKAKTSFDFSFVPFINILFLLFIFFWMTSTVTFSSVVRINLPKTVTSDVINANNITIFVTSEDIFYYNGRVVTLADIKGLLLMPGNMKKSVLIKADRRAYVGRVVDLWNCARDSGVGKINIAADQEE